MRSTKGLPDRVAATIGTQAPVFFLFFTGFVEERLPVPCRQSAASALVRYGRRDGKKMTPERRSEIARAGAAARWGKETAPKKGKAQ